MEKNNGKEISADKIPDFRPIVSILFKLLIFGGTNFRIFPLKCK